MIDRRLVVGIALGAIACGPPPIIEPAVEAPRIPTEARPPAVAIEEPASNLTMLIVARSYQRMIDCGADETIGDLGCAFTDDGEARAIQPEHTLRLFVTDPPGLLLAATGFHPLEKLGDHEAVVADCEVDMRGSLRTVRLAATEGVAGWIYDAPVNVGVASQCAVDPYRGLPKRMAASHVLVMHDDVVRKPPAISRSKDAALERARVAAKLLRQPDAQLAEVARRYSDEAGVQRSGGRLGAFARGKMTRFFEMMVVATEVGARSAVFETEFGFHIMERRRIHNAGADATSSPGAR